MKTLSKAFRILTNKTKKKPSKKTESFQSYHTALKRHT